jgi:protocatechuate 3,4-dioxygenase beta subunit
MLKINNSIKTTVITSIIVTLFFSIFSSSSSEAFAQNTNSLSNNDTKKSEITSSCELTVPTVQGPYYKEGSPIKEGEEFAKGIEGEKLVVTGKVLGSINCNPVNNAILDFWQADSKGQYDNEGFNLRGKIISDENGNYRLDTILPASYSEGNITRPAHIHVKAWIPENPGNPALVTQIYFEGDPNMDIFVKEPLIMKIVDKNGTKFANFNFVLEDYRDFG